MTRLFVPDDATYAQYFDFGYRPFDVGAGYNIGSATAAPEVMDFDRQTVDYGRFLEGTPESDYNGANGVALGFALVAAILTQLW